MKVSCDVIQDLLPLYTDQAASADTVALVEEHLASCPACREDVYKRQPHRLMKPVALVWS